LPFDFCWSPNCWAHGHFTMKDYREWLKKAEMEDLAQALTRLAQLNQSKVYLSWKRGPG